MHCHYEILIDHGADVKKSVGKFYCEKGRALPAALAGGFPLYRSFKDTMYELAAKDEKLGSSSGGRCRLMQRALRDGYYSRQSEQLLSLIIGAGASVDSMKSEGIASPGRIPGVPLSVEWWHCIAS